MSQYFYMHTENPQTRLINQAVAIIKSGGVIAYPTDSGYALGCQFENKEALERICRIRKLNANHNFTLMCRNISELSTYAKVENDVFRLIKSNTPGRYTFIFKATKEVPKRLMNTKRRTIGIRIPDHVISLALLEALDEPIMSTSLILDSSEQVASDPESIREQLEYQLDLIIDGGYFEGGPTSVIDFSEGPINIVREGSGDLAPFY